MIGDFGKDNAAIPVLLGTFDFLLDPPLLLIFLFVLLVTGGRRWDDDT